MEFSIRTSPYVNLRYSTSGIFSWFSGLIPFHLEFVQGVELLGGHFACLCRGIDFYEVKKKYYLSKRKGKYFYTFKHFCSEKSSKRTK
jgi:hypothetical protein